METLITILIGVFVTIGTYLLLSKNVIRIIIGSSILTHAAHLLIITMPGLKTGGVPFITDGAGGEFVDPLPQALILTSIVINFAVTALILVLAFRAYKTLGTDNLAEMRGPKYD